MTALSKEQRQVWTTLKDPWVNQELTDNPSIVREINLSKKLGYATPPLGRLIVRIADRIIKNKGFTYFTYREDLVSAIVTQLLISYSNFTGGQQSYAYLVSAGHSAAVRYVHKERKEECIKHNLMELCLTENN